MTGSRRTIVVQYTETVDHIDPLALSRDLDRTARRATTWLRGLRHADGLDDDPFQMDRWVSGRETFLRVSEMHAEDPLREPLRRWVYRTAELRINRAALCRVTAAYRVDKRNIESPEQGQWTLHDVFHRALSEKRRRKAWLDAYFGAAEPLADACKMLWERRSEIAARMGLSNLDAIEGIGVVPEEAAELWLDRSRDAFEEYRTEGLAELVTNALGSDASEGWPGRIALDTLMDWFRDSDLFRSLDLDPGSFVEPLGASSFMRALRRLGAAWADAAGPRDQPFVIANDPLGLRRRTTGALFGALPMDAEFAMRRLGVARTRLADHRRKLARVRLVDSRLGALKVLLRRAAIDGNESMRQRFEELCERAIGFSLPRAAVFTIFLPAVDEPQRFAGRLLSATRTKALREAHDEDWFRNPRAVDQLRAEGALSPEYSTTKEAVDVGMEVLQAELVDALR